MELDQYLKSMPLLHSWDGGTTWNSGGFSSEELGTLHQFLRSRLPEHATLLETGAGNSTIMMLFLQPARIISIAPDQELFGRIYEFCRMGGIPTNSLEVHVDGSQWVLPKLAADNRSLEPILDFALIDGCHSWPTCLVDLEYTNAMLKRDAFLLIDDVQLHSVKEMARLLTEHPDFSLALDLGKSLVFKKLTNDRNLGGWEEQPYIVRRGKEYMRYTNPYALHEFRARRLSNIAHLFGTRLPQRLQRQFRAKSAQSRSSRPGIERD
jgi:hypothetical protein